MEKSPCSYRSCIPGAFHSWFWKCWVNFIVFSGKRPWIKNAVLVWCFLYFPWDISFKFQGTIPLCFHVDGAEFYSNSEYICWSVASLLSDAHVFDSKFPVAILPHQSMQTESVKRDVHRLVAKVIGWSLKISASGIGPTTGPFGETLTGERAMMAGKPLASGWRGTYFGCRFDEKARKEVNEFPRSYQHSLVCMNCLAQQPHKDWEPELCYKNFHSSAAYRLCPISFWILNSCTFFFGC